MCTDQYVTISTHFVDGGGPPSTKLIFHHIITKLELAVTNVTLRYFQPARIVLVNYSQSILTDGSIDGDLSGDGDLIGDGDLT